MNSDNNNNDEILHNNKSGCDDELRVYQLTLEHRNPPRPQTRDSTQNNSFTNGFSALSLELPPSLRAEDGDQKNTEDENIEIGLPFYSEHLQQQQEVYSEQQESRRPQESWRSQAGIMNYACDRNRVSRNATPRADATTIGWPRQQPAEWNDLIEQNQWEAQNQKRMQKEHEKEMQMISIRQAHRRLLTQVDQDIKSGFSSMQSSLTALQLQLHRKLAEVQRDQEKILDNYAVSSDTLDEFYQNMHKIQRTLESFTAHADNLSHIKLTLARACSFVSPEGNIAQLVTLRPADPDKFFVPQQQPNNKLSFVPQQESLQLDLQQPAVQQHRVLPNFAFNASTYLQKAISSSAPQQRTPLLSVPSPQPSLERPAQQHQEHFRSYDGDDELTFKQSSSFRIPNSTCFVFYLPPTATNETLRQLFMRYGTVLNAYVAMDKVTNRTRGFGFVDFSTPSEAQAAVAGLDKYPLEGKFLSVSIKV